MFCPKGTAFLWVPKRLHSPTFPSPSVISSFDQAKFSDRFVYSGTRDYTSLCAIPSGLDFVEKMGGSYRIRQYNSSLVAEVARRLCNAWGTTLLVPEDMTPYAMTNVVLPSSDADKISRMQQELDATHHIYITCGHVDLGDIHYVRISAQIYLALEDFLPLEYLVPQLLK